MLDVHLIIHTIALASHTLAAPAPPATGSNPGGTNIAPSALTGFLTDIATTLWTLGTILCVIGLIVGGIMRATAFGSERRIATSNVALSCAVLGFLIILLANPIGNAIHGLF